MQDLIEENRRMMSDSASEWRSKTMIDVLLSLQQNEPQYYKDEITRGLMLRWGVDDDAIWIWEEGMPWGRIGNESGRVGIGVTDSVL
ncbi:unnamed protein product [Camellia sinensis]